MTNYDRLKIGVYGLGILLTVIEVVENGKGSIIAHSLPSLFIIPILTIIVGTAWCLIDIVIESLQKDLIINYKIHGLGMLSNIIFAGLVILILTL
ncbi:MAG: hypothetical protein COB15_17175 [Flavobacteriales bacterium]|nr:MAG: hypothetical protein COB15_17175 [Flavobacteriales bacterium]